MQDHDGLLNFATDCWTAPNRRAYMAVTVQYEMEGTVHQWLLDIVEVGHRHTGAWLALEFVKILDDFGIRDKVSLQVIDDQR